jgi:hypothetical protein
MPALSLDLDDAALDRLADQLAVRILARLPEQSGEDGWLDAGAAAAYLGISVTSLHKLTSARRLEFSQAAPGGRC